jgi:hypothetical protein
MAKGIVTIATVVAVCALLSACGSSALSRPTAVDASIVAAALKQKSVHWTEVDAGCPIRRSSDVEAHSGTEHVTFYCSASPRPKGEAQIVLVDHVVYVRGDPGGLGYTLHLTYAKARKYAARWISIPKGSGPYSRMADGLTLASIVHNDDPARLGMLTVERKQSRETELLGVVGSNSVCTPPDPHCGPTATLTARANGDRLPVTFTSSGCAGCVFTDTFSKWNEPVRIQVPARSMPVATVCGRCRAESLAGLHG